MIVALTRSREFLYRLLPLRFWLSLMLALRVTITVPVGVVVGGPSFSNLNDGGFGVIISHFFKDRCSFGNLLGVVERSNWYGDL